MQTGLYFSKRPHIWWKFDYLCTLLKILIITNKNMPVVPILPVCWQKASPERITQFQKVPAFIANIFPLLNRKTDSNGESYVLFAKDKAFQSHHNSSIKTDLRGRALSLFIEITWHPMQMVMDLMGRRWQWDATENVGKLNAEFSYYKKSSM